MTAQALYGLTIGISREIGSEKHEVRCGIVPCSMCSVLTRVLVCLRADAPCVFPRYSSIIMENTSTLDLSLRLRGGGKVHGSLARAGKVKGQTPKVAKQEESKKALTGRAKKRWQYNRRFVNVTAGIGGKKLGPNSNAPKQ